MFTRQWANKPLSTVMVALVATCQCPLQSHRDSSLSVPHVQVLPSCTWALSGGLNSWVGRIWVQTQFPKAAGAASGAGEPHPGRMGSEVSRDCALVCWQHWKPQVSIQLFKYSLILWALFYPLKCLHLQWNVATVQRCDRVYQHKLSLALYTKSSQVSDYQVIGEASPWGRACPRTMKSWWRDRKGRQ